MLIQLMNAIKQLKRISQRLNNFAFGASIGIHLACLVRLFAREIIIFVFKSFFNRILVAVLTVCERIGDTFISWVPMYSEAKLAFFIFLWYPKTKGTTYVYDSFFRPYVAKHETEIDRNLLELRTRAGDIAVVYWQRAFSYGQTRIYDILQFVAAQSTPSPRPAQQRPGVRVRQPAPAKPAAATEPQVEEPPSPTSSTSSSQLQNEVAEELGSHKCLNQPHL
ncbi:HVA22 protein i [Spatholobus suberectus]|nr:HVA22 protein i [Spatholobus suberectus]